jgi:SAM-dependent methyltransferase
VIARTPPGDDVLEPSIRTKLNALIDEGWEIWDRFDSEVRQKDWHPFVPADYERMMPALLALRAPGRRFLEWGSATGIVTIMADLLGYEAYGIELDAGLVDVSRELATRYDSSARFVAGSFLPAGYRWKANDGDDRPGTIGDGSSAYPALGHPLEDFDVVYGYPWTGEEPMMQNLMRTFGNRKAQLLLNGPDGVRLYSGERFETLVPINAAP